MPTPTTPPYWSVWPQIKRKNKEDFAAYAKKTQGVILNPDAIFDVQVKRLHEYKRQLLNVLHIIALYQRLHDDPNAITQPHTFLFGAKAAPAMPWPSASSA